jgi:hypothetical protein
VRSLQEKHLKDVKDLYLNFWRMWACPLILLFPDPPAAIESQAFSLKSPEHFFSLYSPPKTDNAFKASRERLEEDIKFMSKMVRLFFESRTNFPTHERQDRQRLYQSERIPVHPLLYALSSRTAGCSKTSRTNPPCPTSYRRCKSMADEPRAWCSSTSI